ncbi:MAG: ZIP family metal transporter [Chitinophagaceae bacterium]|nr:ZIP family metal transporter [Chitinophagaceae bacterium]
MINIILIFFFSTLFGGCFIFFIKKPINKYYKYFKIISVFSGAFLFSLTIIHIFPEVFRYGDSFHLELFVLLGFLLQYFLSFFSGGVEHGHIHTTDTHKKHSSFNSYSVSIALFLHSFLEGGILIHSDSFHQDTLSISLLVGILFHKILESFAFMFMLVSLFWEKKKLILFLFLFACSSPLGILAIMFLKDFHSFYENYYPFMYAFMSGIFLLISTTMVFESSPKHTFQFLRNIFIILGAIFAIMFNYFFH